MKMIPGTGTIYDYPNYVSNCVYGQMPYKIPVNSLADIQLYINIGEVRPSAAKYELVKTCGGDSESVEIIVPTDYVVAQDTNDNWYGIFRNFETVTSATCFVVAITLTISGVDKIFFSEEYCLEKSCEGLTYLEGCYGNLDNRISYDADDIYFGKHDGTGTPMGDTSVIYKHQIYMRGVDVTLSAIKNSFKQGRTRNFRTEKEKIYEFWSELVPEWYVPYVDAIFYRGEVYIGSEKYLLNETAFEKVEDCKRIWHPKATFKKSSYQSFSCEADPCIQPSSICCDPSIISATVYFLQEESGANSGSGVVVENPEEIIIQGEVGGTIIKTGTIEPVVGIYNGSLIVDCVGFQNVYVRVMRGGFQIPAIDPGDGSQYYTKSLISSTIVFSAPLVEGELIYIQTL